MELIDRPVSVLQLQGPAGNDGTPGRDGAVGERVRISCFIKSIM